MAKKWLLTMCLFLLPASATAMDIDITYDDNFDFSQFKAYLWTDGTPTPDPEAQAYIVAEIEERLSKAGLGKVKEAPQLLITTHAFARETTRLDVTQYGYGSDWYGWGGDKMSSREIRTGTLIIDIVHAETNQLIWRGEASDAIREDFKKNKSKIGKAIKKLLKKFPPKKK